MTIFVLITASKKNKHHQNSIKTLSEHLYKIIWSTQKKRTTYDNSIIKGTHIFYRKYGNVPYRYLGKVITKPLILIRRTQFTAVTMEFFVWNKHGTVLCDDIDETEQYKYQNACWRTIGLPKFRGGRRGIYIV